MIDSETLKTIEETPGYTAQAEEYAEISNNQCNSFGSCIANVVYLFTVGIGSGVAYFAAWVLSIAVKLSLSSTAYALGFLSTTWGFVRDMANMLFILILVYIAFTIMLRADTTETMKRLAWVIVIALLINFSFFFVRVVIDTGNLLAIQVYNAIDGPPIGETITQEQTGLTGTAAAILGPGATTKDLTSSIMNGIGVQKILSNESFKKFQDSNDWFTELIALSFVYIAVGAMFFMLAAAFFTVGVKFIIRIVVLWLLLVVSPLALIAKTVKQWEPWYNKWQSLLIVNTFYPAVFLFVFYITTLVMADLAPGGSTIVSQTFGDLSNIQSQGLLGIVPVVAVIAIRLGFVLALLYIGLKASERIGVVGANLATGVTRWATRGASNVGFGGLAWAGRQTIGRGAGAWAERPGLRALDIEGKRRSRVGNTLLTRIGGGLMQKPLSILQKTAAGSYDVRGLPGPAGPMLRDVDYGLGPINYDLGKASRARAAALSRVAARLRQTSTPGPQSTTTTSSLGTPTATTTAATTAMGEKQLVALGKIKRAIDDLKHKVGSAAGGGASQTSGAKRSGSTSSPHATDSMDIYAMLGSKIDASQAELRGHYINTIKKLHELANKGDRKATEQLQRINAEYDKVKTPEKRSAYDVRFGTQGAPMNNATADKDKQKV